MLMSLQSSMAAAFSNPSLFPPRLPKPSKTLEIKTVTLQSSQRLPLCISNLGFPLSTSSPIGRRSFKSSLRFEDSESNAIDGEENIQIGATESKSEADQKHLSSLKTLVKVYKEAILNGDEKSVSDIEAMIYMIENEKNELVQKVAALSADITSGKEKCIRLVADLENFRKRSEKERLRLTSGAQGDLIESLLPMVDNFERAKQQIRPETEKEKKIDTSYQGIYKQFVEIIRSLRVAVVPTVGKPFDPSLHEAIAREESQEFKAGIIIQEIRRGFLLGDRLLRPAMVKVSAGLGSKKVPAGSEKSVGQPTAAAGLDDSSVTGNN
ncbi:hypothetical protein HHK36_004390 [Tetracentron sinense]|uniref:GrpE protein homolog n=1 Tax=Tetracentron sinense TaxID=13715 RepID=A0A834ZZV8_TETSI|nr:hypothetical protein HHK36_004390 [Tetracentron sinense]